MLSDVPPSSAAPMPAPAPSHLARTLSLTGFLSGPHGEQVRALHSLPEQVTACGEALPALAPYVTPGDVSRALWLCSKLRALCRPGTAAGWTRAAELLSTRPSWQPKVIKGLAVGTPLVVAVLLAPSVLRRRGYDAWVKATATDGAAAASLQSTAVLLGQDAASISAFPAGAYLHSQAAIADLNAADHALSQLWVLGNDPASLHTAFALHPDPSSVRAHDEPLRRAATVRVHTARGELDIAHHVLGYAQQWSNLALPASLPPGLAGAWSTAASAMDNALHTGDATALQQADGRLSYLQTAGQQLAALQTWAQDLDAADLTRVQPLIDNLTAAIASDDRETAAADVNRWTALKEARQLGYGLLVSASPADTHGVQRQPAGSESAPSDYLIVRAIDSAGHPVTLPVYDSETRTLTRVQTFGVQVTPDIYNAAKAQIATTQAALLVAKKAVGDAAPTFTVPVLSGRITHW